jgi:protein-tyrosine phosphatase
MIDVHAHVLPGLDDGPADVAEALALLRALAAEGVTTVCATPHVSPEYPTRADDRDAALAAVRAAALEDGLAIAIEAGGELDLEYAARWSDEELRRFSLGGGPALLIEFPWTSSWPLALAPTCRALRLRGFLPIVAHPERSRLVQAAPDRLDDVIVSGGVVQVTAGSLTGRFGPRARESGEALIAARRVHLVASDAHDAIGRPPELARARTVAADWLFAAATEVLAGTAPRIPRW